MERLATISNILKIQATIKQKELNKRASNIPDFDRFSVIFLTKKEIKILSNNQKNAATVHELLIDINYNINFDPVRLNSLISLLAKPGLDEIVIQQLCLFALHQYVSFIMQLESMFNTEHITLLFKCLLSFQVKEYDKLLISAICDIFSVMMDNYSHGLFISIFGPFSEYLMNRKKINSSICDFLPMLLKRVIDDGGYSNTSDAARLSSLISILLSDHAKSFTPTAIHFLFEVIKPYLYNVNEFSLIILQNMRPFLDKDQVNTFFLDLPSKFPQIIESANSPFIIPPDPIEYESFNPSPSPECHFRFFDIEPFKDGFDASSSPKLPSPSVVGLCNPQFYSLIELIVKVINNGADEAQLFLDSLSELADAKSTTPYKYDYLGIMILYWIKLTDNLPISQIHFPKYLFEPSLSIFDENLKNASVFFSMRYYGLCSILKVADPHLDKILLQNVKYPRLFTEIMEICNLNLDKISTLIMNQTWMIRTVRLIALQLQSAQINNEISTPCIEAARLSVFRLIFRIFIRTSFIHQFLNDVLFLSFFLSHLFEENIRPFIISQLKIYISSDLTPAQYEKLLNQLCQVIEQVYNILPNKRGLNMLSDILSLLTSKNTKPNLMLGLCSAFHGALQYFDDSNLSKIVLLKIMKLFTLISKTTQSLSKESILALEAPLKKFKKLSLNDFNAVLCLLASEILRDFSPTFKIKNGPMINIMFRVFYDSKDPNINIVNTAKSLVNASTQNCIICHQCHFDITLLNFLKENRESDDPRISEILMIIATIAGVISSPGVVQSYISLFIPVDNRYSSKLHHFLLTPLLHIFTRAQECPSLILPLQQSRIITIDTSKSQLMEGMTFTFWLLYESGKETKIFTLLNGDDKPFFTLGMKKDIITIDGNSTSLNISKKQWKFVALAYHNGVCSIYLNAEEVWKANMTIKFPIGVPTVQIGGKSKSKAQLGNFGLYDIFDPQLIKSIYPLGPRSIQIIRKPLFYFTQENMRTITGYSINSENRTFTDVFFRFFKIEILLPLFAQLDLTLRNGEPSHFDVMEVVAVFKAALFVGELEQYDFGLANGFSIISHLLCSSSPKQISYELYLEFYNIMETLVLKNIQEEIFTQIIMNMDIWIVASPEDHITILKHWKRSIFPTYKELFIKFYPFSYLLDILRIYYWFDPIEKSKIRGEPGSSRPRNPNLNINECRSNMYNIMYDISETKFRNEDFSALMEHIITLEDEKQQLDLLLFMNGLALSPHYPLTTLSNTIPTLSRISFLLHSKNDQIVNAVFNVIYSVHSKSKSDDLTLSQHLDAVMKDIEMRTMSIGLLEDLMKIMICNTSVLFPLCSYLSYRLLSMKIFEQAIPSSSFVSSPYWSIWSVAEAISFEDTQKKMEIFSYLARCSPKSWQTISDTIEIVAQSIGISSDTNKFFMLKVLCQLVLGSDSFLGDDECVRSLFSLLKQHIFYRQINDTSSCSRALKSVFDESPYAKDENGLNLFTRERSKSLRLRALYQGDILNLNLHQFEYKFGLRVDSNSHWRDEELAQLSLKLLTRLRSIKNKIVDNYLDFGFVLSAFLLHHCPDFVNNWLAGMNLVKEDCDSHLIESQYLVAKAASLNIKLLIATQLEDAYAGAYQLFDALNTKFFDPNIANSYFVTHKSMKTFSQQSATNLFLVQQQETRNAEFENDINLATEIIRSHYERNSKLWHRLWSNVVANGAPWDPAKITGKRDVIRWKRDNTFCKYFMPIKMKRNRKYTNHVESSIARDAGNAVSANKMLEDYKARLEAEYQKNAPPELLEIPSQVEKDDRKNDDQIQSTPNNSKKKKRSTKYKCELIKMRGVKTGTFVIFSDSLHINIESTKKTYIIPVNLIEKILLRRRFHIKTAIEIFMISGESYFINFPQYHYLQIIKNLNLPDSVFVQKEEPAAFLQSLGLTEKWQNGKISNFEYLMKLNIISGRSFNDSSQYPFFPWVLSDYSSDELDLTNPESFRDLSKPIGAIGDARFKDLMQRMKDMKMFNSNPYMYSSFAICPLSLYLWLFRIEPFTTLHIEMQSGKFDHPSRLFSSIPDSYGLVTTHMNDYRELCPEFYFLPEFLRNDNDYDLGKAKGVPVDDVVLPKWAKSCEDCVYMFRKALESDIASMTINKWIDIVFGYKQRGEAAKEANNMFMPDMYETAWTPQILKDPRRHAEIEAAMCHVGQFPPQLFTSEHPAKIMKLKALPPITIVQLPYPKITTASMCYPGKLILSISSDQTLATLTLSASGTYFPTPASNQSLSPTSSTPVTPRSQRSNSAMDSELSLNIPKLDLNIPQIKTVSTSRSNSNLNSSSNSIPGQNSPEQNVTVKSNISIDIPDTVLELINIKKTGDAIALLKNGKLIQMSPEGNYNVFMDELTRVSSIATSNEFIAAISDDTTLNLIGRGVKYSIPFYGDTVTCCAVSKSFKIVVCGTISGNVVICSLFEGRKVNVISLGKDVKPTKILITKSWGFIVTYANSITSKQKRFLFVHNVNGHLIRSVELQTQITKWCTFSSNQAFDYIIAASEQGKLHLIEAFYLDMKDPFYRCYKSVVGLFYLKYVDIVVAVLEDGNVVFHPICVN